jgi:DNA-binding transcriptional ArsR family regulator
MTPETDTSFVPADQLVVDNLDMLKVVADPLRLRILELMRDVCTVKQVAAELDIPPTKLYYHINLLEKHGFIAVVDTRVVSGIIEKHYQATAYSIHVDHKLLSPGTSDGSEGLLLTVDSIYANVRDDLSQSLSDGTIQETEGDDEKHLRTGLGAMRMFLTEEQAKDFYDRLTTLFEEMKSLSESQHDLEDTRVYRMFYTVFPSSRRRIPQDKQE